MGLLVPSSSPDSLPGVPSSPGGGPCRSGNGLWLFGRRRTSPDAVMGGDPGSAGLLASGRPVPVPPAPAPLAAEPVAGPSAPTGKTRRGGTFRLWPEPGASIHGSSLTGFSAGSHGGCPFGLGPRPALSRPADPGVRVGRAGASPARPETGPSGPAPPAAAELVPEAPRAAPWRPGPRAPAWPAGEAGCRASAGESGAGRIG